MAQRPDTSSQYSLVGTGLNPDASVVPPPNVSLPQIADEPPTQEPERAPIPPSDVAIEQDTETPSQNQDVMNTTGLYPAGPEAYSDDFQVLPDYANGLSEETPINMSPLEISDRIKLSMGNKVGKLQYLKQRYQDAKLDSKGNFNIQKDGIWYRADADGLGDGDAWERTKELVADMADLTDIGLVTAGQIGGAVAGGAAASPTIAGIPAAAVAGGAIGAAAGGALKSRLGRLVGTYNASPEEEIKDAALEGVLGLGGEVIGLGAKVGIKAIKGAFSRIGETAANQSKELLSAAMGQAYGYPRASFRRAMDDPKVLDIADRVIKQAGRSADINKLNQIVNGERTAIVNSMAEEAPKALQKQFEMGVKEIEAALPKDFSVDLASTVVQVGDTLANAGLLKSEKVGKKQVFSVFNPKELAAQFSTEMDQLPKILSPEMMRNVNMVAKTLNTYSSLPKVNGKLAARKLLEVKNAMNDVFGELIERAPEGSRLKALGAEMKTQSNQVFAQKFADAGVGRQYIAVNKRYTELADSAKMLQQIKNTPTMQREGMVNALVKKLSDQSGSYKQLQGEAKALSSLFQKQTGDPVQRLLDLEAASAFVDMVPKNLSGNSLTTAIRAGAALTGGPRMGARAIKTAKYANKFADFAKNLGPKQSALLLQNPNALREVLRQVSEGPDQEEAATQQLLQQAQNGGQ